MYRSRHCFADRMPIPPAMRVQFGPYAACSSRRRISSFPSQFRLLSACSDNMGVAVAVVEGSVVRWVGERDKGEC